MGWPMWRKVFSADVTKTVRGEYPMSDELVAEGIGPGDYVNFRRGQY